MLSSRLNEGKVEDSEDELHLVDAVLAAFCFQSGKEKQPSRRLRIQAVYRTFAELRKKYPNWLQEMNFTFGPADTVPVSGVLEDILFDLGTSGIMSVYNPFYKHLSISASKQEIIRKAINQRRNKTEQSELRRLADEFHQLYSEAVKKG